MSTWQQTQTPYGSGGAAPPPPGFYPQGAPYPKADGGYTASGGYPPPPYPQQNMPYYGGSNVPQNDSYNAPDNFGFSDKSIRQKFISKVYCILMFQLLITLGFVSLGTFHEPTKLFIKSNPMLSILAIVVTFGTLIALACCENLRRNSPTNFILLFVFTIAESFLLAVTVSRYYPSQVLMALGLTTLICFALTVFALQTKIDFTVMGGFLMVAAIVLLVVSIVAMFFPGKLMTLIIASAGAIIFSLYLIYDTQMMVGGDHKYSISPEEYVFAALTIYVDVINIFIYILTIIGASGDD